MTSDCSKNLNKDFLFQILFNHALEFVRSLILDSLELGPHQRQQILPTKTSVIKKLE